MTFKARRAPFTRSKRRSETLRASSTVWSGGPVLWMAPSRACAPARRSPLRAPQSGCRQQLIVFLGAESLYRGIAAIRRANGGELKRPEVFERGRPPIPPRCEFPERLSPAADSFS